MALFKCTQPFKSANSIRTVQIRAIMYIFKLNSLTGGNSGRIQELFIANTKFILDKLQIANLTIDKFSINQGSLAGEIYIFDSFIRSFLINKIRNNGFIKVINVKALKKVDRKSFLTINESNLGKTEFFQMDFSSFDEVNIKDSVLIDCIFINTT